jgi:glycine/D-amino acid oxidase-like deaminating enzyme
MSLQSSESADVVIIGGGVIGLTIARALRQRGVGDVTVIER